MKKIITLSLVFIFAFGFAQKFDQKKLDDYFNTLDQNHKVMGSFAVAKNDKIIYTKTIGFLDAENKTKPNENSIYRIGSISKTFTAVLVMKAMEEGKIKLDEKLNEFFPAVKNASKITIENLLNHRSGIHNITEDESFFSIHTQPILKTDLLKRIENLDSDFDPGTDYEYSNSNYILLGLILEKIYEQEYQQLLQNKIIQPLGLKNTSVGDAIETKKNEASTYYFVEEEYKKSDETHMSIALGAGNLVSTPSELLKVIIALENGKLVSKESLKKMKNFQDHYGLGIAEVPFDGKKGYGHNGRIDEFQSTLYYFPDGKVSISFITNQSNFDNNNISIAMASAAYGKDFNIPSFSNIQVKEEELKKYEGWYSTPDFPLKMNIFTKNGKLHGQASGQGAFPLEATSENEFEFEQASITMKFDSAKDLMYFTQMGQNLVFKKEK